jgi:hypothetical protein
MAEESQEQTKGFHLSLDWWAVLTALAFALLVKVGVIHKVPW